MTIEELVLEFQGGNSTVFNELYVALQSEMKKMAKWLRRNMPTAVVDDDISALCDDALLSAVGTFSAEQGAKFTTHFWNVLGNMRKTTLDKCNAEKRTGRKKDESDDSTLVNLSIDYGKTEDGLLIAEVLEDFSAQKGIAEVEGSAIMNNLIAYSALSSKTNMNAILIVHDTMFYETAEEKYDTLRELTGLTASNSALRKKCQRAKADFRAFVVETEIN